MTETPRTPITDSWTAEQLHAAAAALTLEGNYLLEEADRLRRLAEERAAEPVQLQVADRRSRD